MTERIRFRTETGSVYEIVREGPTMTWRRLSTTLASGVLRSEEGRLLAWTAVTIGERVELLSEPIVPQPDKHGRNARLVRTSRAVAIDEQEPSERSAGVLPPGWPSFRDIDVGDHMVRMLGGHEMPLRITGRDDDYLYVGDPGQGWKFDRDTGIEVDEEIGFGPQFGIIGTYLVHPKGSQGRSRADRPMGKSATGRSKGPAKGSRP